MSELRDRLEQLASRGSRRGADEVLNAAQRGVTTNEVETVPDDNVTDLPIIDTDPPMVTAEHEPRSRFRTLVATFGIAALVGVGGLAIASVFGSGGADSPEGAVRQLAEAISHKDPLAAVDVLSPAEVRSMRQSVDNATRRAADLKIVDSASAPLAGVDLSVDNLQLSTQPLADGFTKVTVTGGEITAGTHTAAMSKLLQDAIKDEGNAPGKVDLAKLGAEVDGLPTFVVTVRRDGRWYVSPMYTAFEYARLADGGPSAEFGSAKAATNLGADTPENAVSDALRAWQAGDWNRLMALAPPDELPVYDYRAWLGQVGAESNPDFTIDKLTTSASVSGDTATVKLDASGTMGRGDDQGKWQVGGTCPSSMGGWYSYGSSFNEASGPLDVSLGTSDGSQVSTPTTEVCLSGDLGNIVPFGLYPMGVGDVAQSGGSVSVDVVRENGRWFVSPVTTVLKALDSTVQKIDERSVYTLLGLAYQLPTDGKITLDQPFAMTNHGGYFASSVFEFDGTQGQEVVGEIEGTRYYASGQIYTADGKEVDYVDFSPRDNGYAYAVELPATGSYRLVVNGGAPDGTKLTLWDKKHAPKGLLSEFPGSSEECTSSGGGVTSCSSSGSSIDSFECTIENNALTCPGGGPSTPICTPNAPNVDDCIPADIAKSMTSTGGIVTPVPSPGAVTPTTFPVTVKPTTSEVTETTGVTASVP